MDVRIVGFCLSLKSAISTLLVLIGLSFHASTYAQSVVINEIHYNPPDSFDDVGQDVEFLELYNNGDAAVDLSGAIVSGIDFTFPANSIITQGQYIILSPSAEDALLVWGVEPFGIYAGGLSGKGELIELIASDSITVIDSVDYDDNTPWPGSPDGNGPSLELLNPGLENSDAQNWAASTASGPSPGAQNTVFTSTEPQMFGAFRTVPAALEPDSDFFVEVDLNNAAEAQVFYKINMEQEIGPLEMNNVAEDVWQAEIPGQADGALVRFRFVSGSLSSPSPEDTINYHAIVLPDSDIVGSQLPVFQFFISDEDYIRLYDTPFDNDEFPIVVAYGDQVIDNALIRVRGASSRKFLKKNYKVELPDGYEFDLGDLATHALDEFAWQADRGDVPFTQTLFSWDTLAEEGEPDVANFHIRLERNSNFFGLYRFQEVYDGGFRSEFGYDEGELYEAGNGGWKDPTRSNIYFKKKHPDDGDFSNLQSAVDSLHGLDSDALKSWTYRNVDIPAIINYAALSSLLRHGDQEYKNYYTYLNNDTDRWSMLFWDLDQTWLYGSSGPCPVDDLTIPTCLGNPLIDSVLNIEEFQQMYWTRVSALVDKYLYVYDMEARREEAMSFISVEEAELDLQAWGAEGNHWDSNLRLDSYYRDRWEESLVRRRATFENESRLVTAPLNPLSIFINELHYNPANDEPEFLELYNPNEVAIDLSGWSIDGVGHDIRFGTVIPARGFAVFTESDTDFKANYEGDIFVAGQYSGGLKNGGESIQLLDAAGIVVDEVEYGDSAPWPELADGGGFSLSLISPVLDNTAPESWADSSVYGGTPGEPNDVGVNPPILTLLDQSVGEEDADKLFSVSVGLDAPRPIAVSYSFETVDGSALADSDYVAATGVVEFAPGEVEVAVDVTILGNTSYEGDRDFTFTFAPLGSGLLGSVGVISILDDELPPDVDAPTWLEGTISVLGVTHNSISVSWSGATDDRQIDGFILYVTDESGTTLQFESDGESLNIEDLTPQTSYTIRIEAVDGAGNVSDDGPGTTVSTSQAPDLTAPEWNSPTLIVSNETRSTMELSWSGAVDDRNVTAYLVTYSAGEQVPVSIETNEPSVVLDGLLPETEYLIRIEARDAAGNVSTTGPEVVASTNLTATGLLVDVDSVSNTYTLSSASGQDRGPGSANFLDGGLQLELTGNLWKRIEINYDVNEDTILQFDFVGEQEGEVHAIGFETNSVVSSSLTFQLWGTQNFGKQQYRTYASDAGSVVRYQIPVGSILRNREYKYLTFISDQDRGPFDAKSRFYNISLSDGQNLPVDTVPPVWADLALVVDEIDTSSAKIQWSAAEDDTAVSVYQIFIDGILSESTSGLEATVTGLAAEQTFSVEVVAIDLEGNQSVINPQAQFSTLPAPDGFEMEIEGQTVVAEVLSFGGQDRSGDFSLQQEGKGIQLSGNTWKYIETDISITPETMLLFDFSSDSEGGIHGVAVENNLWPSSSRTFKLFGFQRYGIRDFETYEPGSGVVRYAIPIGQFTSGNNPFIVFVNNHDVRNPTARSVFSNIVIQDGL